ncbi:unnamed protein product [Cladocopium goreaui]|uniref:Aurora kinase B-A n=1 Tax=Cladocopium goreaui TaxID=2562237 RepID=A0A9P1BIT8_9DINO|nr:unnamed protein product [Cladocopium goreaui]
MTAVIEDVDDDVCAVQVTRDNVPQSKKNNICIDDDVDDAEDVCVTHTKTGTKRPVTLVESDSESSSSGSNSQRRKTGAAAATALLTASNPLDVDEADKVIHRILSFPTKFAGPLQHEGGLVQVMAECEVNISVQPGDSSDATAIKISGKEHALGRAVAQIELQFQAFAEAERKAKEEAESNYMDQVKIPEQLLCGAVGPNGRDLPKVREKCKVMIALMPPEAGHLTAHIGPGTEEQVKSAKAELLQRISAAEKAKADAANPSRQLSAEFQALMEDVGK